MELLFRCDIVRKIVDVSTDDLHHNGLDADSATIFCIVLLMNHE